MRNTFNVLFYIKKNAPLRNGNAPIMGRITINGERTQFSTRLSVAPEHWDVGMGRVAGRSNAAGRINEQLSNIHYHIERCYNKLFYEQSFVTPMMVKEMYFGANLRQETVLAFFRQHNEEFNRMVGISRSKATYYKYRCVCKHLANYIWDKYDRKDLMFKELNREFLTGFHAYIAKEAGYKKKHDLDLHDRPETHPHAGPQQGIYGQGYLCQLQITKRIRNTQLPDHGRDNPYDAVRERRPHLTTCQGHVFV